MANTKLFKNGYSQAVRIPSELADNSWESNWPSSATVMNYASVLPAGAWVTCWVSWRCSPPTS